MPQAVPSGFSFLSLTKKSTNALRRRGSTGADDLRVALLMVLAYLRLRA